MLESSCLVNFSSEEKGISNSKALRRSVLLICNTVLSCKRRLCWQDDSCSVCCDSVFSPVLGRQPSKYNRLLWQPLECPAVPGSLPDAWVTKAEAKRGKAWERKRGGREKELMLEISRKEAKSLNAPLAEILGKMGRNRAKLRDFVPPQVAVTPGGGTAAVPLKPKPPQTIRGAANSQALISSLLAVLKAYFCSCSHFINQHPLLCFLPF